MTSYNSPSKFKRSSKKPYVPDAKETSLDEERMIKEAPMPFKNRMETPQMPASKGPRMSQPGPVQKPYANLSGQTVGVKALPQGGAVGQKRMPSQSGQMNGRMGTSFPRKVGQNGQGFPSKRNASFYGE